MSDPRSKQARPQAWYDNDYWGGSKVYMPWYDMPPARRAYWRGWADWVANTGMDTCLDVGGGDGCIGAALADRGWCGTYVLHDFSRLALDRAAERLGGTSIDYQLIHGDITQSCPVTTPCAITIASVLGWVDDAAVLSRLPAGSSVRLTHGTLPSQTLICATSAALRAHLEPHMRITNLRLSRSMVWYVEGVIGAGGL